MKNIYKKLIIAMAIFLFLFSIIPISFENRETELGNFKYDLKPGMNVYELFGTAAVSDYVDVTTSELLGTTNPDPPSGMGADSDAYSSLVEGAIYGTEHYWGETSGPSYRSILSNDAHGIQVQSYSGDNVVTRSKCKLAETSGTHYAKMFITTTSGVILANGVSNPVAIPAEAGPTIFTFSYATYPVISGGTYYKIWVITDSSMNLYYDSTGYTSYYDTTNSYTTPQNPSSTLDSGKSYTLYAYSKTLQYQFDNRYAFNSVAYSTYDIWTLYVDFDTALSGSDDLDFSIGSAGLTLVGNDKQNDFNVDVSAYIDDSTINLQIADDYRSGDLVQTTANLRRVYLYGETSNTAPANDATPGLSPIHDTDNMYAHATEYSVTMYSSDGDGYADIDYMEIGIWDNTETTEFWRGRYDEDTNTFSEQYDAGTMVSLNTGSSSASRSGNDIDATFVITIDWDFTDSVDIDTKCYVIDSASASDTDWYESNWDIETRLDYSTAPSVNDGSGTADRGNLDGSFTISGTLKYYTSSTPITPPDSAVDVWASCSEYGTTTGPFSDLSLSSGVFSITAYADDVVGIDTWTIKPVEDGAGSGGGTLYYTTDLTDTYISDRIQVVSYSIVGGDDRINIGATTTIDVTLIYDYDDAQLTDGTVTINGFAGSHQGAGVWRFTDTEASVIMNTYDTVTCSGNTHGITVVDQNSQSESVIWDRILVSSYTIDGGDDRINIGATTTIDVRLYYEYDMTLLTDGTTTVNGLSASYIGSGYWRFTDSEANVILNTYDTVACSGNTYGITTVNQNGQSETVIWDRVQIQQSNVNDNRVNINDNVNIEFRLFYDYDNSIVSDGTTTINGYTASYLSDGWWRITRTSASVTSVIYNTVTSTGNAYGITEVDMNGQSETVIWDRIQVVSYTVSDSRDNINDDVTIDATLIYDYDNAQLTDGTVTINGYSAVHQGGGVWRITRTSATVTAVTYNTVACSGNTYGITEVDQNSQSTTVIWDRVQVQSYSVSDSRDDLNHNVNIDVTIVYDYDNAQVTDGSVTINGYSATHQGGGVWRITRTSASVTSVTYNTVVSSGNAYGITQIDQNGQSTTVIWDKVTITLTINYDWTLIGYSLTIEYTGIYQYDSGSFVGTITINSTASTFTPSYSTVGERHFTTTTISDSNYGLTGFDTNVLDAMWDTLACDSISYEWTMYSLNEVQITIDTGTWRFSNGTAVGSGLSVKIWVNSTLQISTNTVSGQINNQIIGPFGNIWYYANFVGNITIVPDARTLHYEWWDVVLEVPVGHTIHLASFTVNEYDTYIWFTWSTVWNNGTFTLWDNSTKITYVDADPGTYRLDLSTVQGFHNLTLLFNCSDSGGGSASQVKDFSINDYWLWLNYYYYVGDDAGGALYWTVVWSFHQDFNLDYFYTWQMEQYPEWAGKSFWMVWGDLDTSVDTITVTAGLFIEFTVKGSFFTIYGTDVLLVPINSYMARDLASQGYASGDNIYDISYDGRTVDAAADDAVNCDWVGDYAYGPYGAYFFWAEDHFTEYVTSNIYGNDVFFFYGNDYLVSANGGMYLVIGNGSVVDYNTIKYDLLIAWDGGGVRYNQKDSYADLYFSVLIDNQFVSHAFGTITYSAGLGYGYLELTVDNYDFTVITKQTEVKIELEWGFARQYNQTFAKGSGDQYAVCWIYQDSSDLTIDIYPSLSITIEFWTPLESTIRLTGVTNYAFNYYLYLEGIYQNEYGTISVDSQGAFSFTVSRATADGNHNYGIYCNSSTTSGDRWINFTEYVSTTFIITDIVLTETTSLIHVSCYTNLAGNYYIYSNNTYQYLTDSFSIGSVDIQFSKKTTTNGLHQWALKFNTTTGLTRWVNGSYTTTGNAGTELFYWISFSLDNEYNDNYGSFQAYPDLTGKLLMIFFGDAITGWVDGEATTVYWEDYLGIWEGYLAGRFVKCFGGEIIAVPITAQTIDTLPYTYYSYDAILNITWYLSKGGVEAIHYNDYAWANIPDWYKYEEYLPEYVSTFGLPDMNYNEPYTPRAYPGDYSFLVPKFVSTVSLANGSWTSATTVSFDAKIVTSITPTYEDWLASEHWSFFYFDVLANGEFVGKAFGQLEYDATMVITLYGTPNDLRYQEKTIKFQYLWGISTYYNWTAPFSNDIYGFVRTAQQSYNIISYAPLDIDVEYWNPTDTLTRITGTANDDFTYYLYLEGVYQSEYGTVSVDTSGQTYGAFSFTVTRTITTGNHNYAIYCNSSVRTGTRWINFTEYVPTTLYIQDVVYTSDDTTLYVSGYASVTFSYIIYEETVEIGSGSLSSGSFIISWTRASTYGTIDWEIRFFVGESTDQPDTVETVSGTYDSGNLASVLTNDTDYYTVTEAIGTPGFDIRFNITTTTITQIHVLTYYDGSNGHDVYGQLYNWATSTWVPICIIEDATGFEWFNCSVPLTGYTFISSGKAILRFYHSSPGNINHHIYIDYINIVTYDKIRYLAGSYYNPAPVLTISDTIYTNSDTLNRLSGETNLGATWEAYDNGSLITGGTITAGSFSIAWARQTEKGLHNWYVTFTDGTTTVTKYGSYESQGLLILQLFVGQDNDTIFISGQIYSTDLTLSYWIWEDSGSGNTLMGSGSITLAQATAWFSINWDKSSENVEANWTLTVTDGSNNSTAYGWYTELDSAVTNITNNAAHYQDQSVENQTINQGDVYTGPSPEAAWVQTLGYIVLTFCMVFLVGATYYAARGYRTKRGKRDRGSDWLTQRR